MTSAFARAAVAAGMALIVGSAVGAAPSEQLGTVSFANSCAAAVQPRLQRAVALLHSFWWSEGDKAFREVLQQDPGCAIATWGIATIAIGNPYSSGAASEPARLAQEALAQGRAIGAKTERERGYIEAIAAYYDRFAERPHPARLRSLADAFEALAKQYPDDDETQIFSAIYLVATQAPSDKSFARAMQGAGILEAQYQKHPNHPGVAHYLIHAYDYPSIADKGLAAAMCYADIAPSAPHALHMPSHIFTRVGLWQESAATNRRSAAAGPGDGERQDRLHALDYLVLCVAAAGARPRRGGGDGGSRTGVRWGFGERLCPSGDPGALRDRARHVGRGGGAARSGQEQFRLHRCDALLRARARRRAQRQPGGR
jgi:hypothetical protein